MIREKVAERRQLMQSRHYTRGTGEYRLQNTDYSSPDAWTHLGHFYLIYLAAAPATTIFVLLLIYILCALLEVIPVSMMDTEEETSSNSTQDSNVFYINVNTILKVTIKDNDTSCSQIINVNQLNEGEHNENVNQLNEIDHNSDDETDESLRQFLKTTSESDDIENTLDFSDNELNGSEYTVDDSEDQTDESLKQLLKSIESDDSEHQVDNSEDETDENLTQIEESDNVSDDSENKLDVSDQSSESKNDKIEREQSPTENDIHSVAQIQECYQTSFASERRKQRAERRNRRRTRPPFKRIMYKSKKCNQDTKCKDLTLDSHEMEIVNTESPPHSDEEFIQDGDDEYSSE